MRRHPFAVALAGWTLFVWPTRIANIWRDEALTGGEKVGGVALALAFTLLAAAVLVTLWRGPTQASRVAVGALATVSVVVWLVRGAGIVLADHDLAFTIVHVVLGAVSIALAAFAVRELRRTAAANADDTSTSPVPAASR
jgi:hypothetical protein